MKQARVLNDKELKMLINSTKLTKYENRNKLIVMLSYCAGLRACEIANLRIGDVIGSDGEAKGTIVLESWQTKGAQRQQAVLSEKLRKEIGHYVKCHRAKASSASPLLVSQKGGSFSSQTIQQIFRNLYKQIGMDGASSHSGRRTMLTKLAERGVHARVIQQIARHSSLATTQRYIEVSPHLLRNAVEML
jgi:integrase/recombinase XerD